MIHIFTGLPGSGKTVKVVDDFGNKKENAIYYTNVPTTYSFFYPNQYILKEIEFWKYWLEYVNDVALQSLDKDTFVRNYKETNPDLAITNATIYLDECHLMGLGQSTAKLQGFINFLTLHRHLELDVWLITQNSSLLNREIVQLVEIHYYAQPSSGRFFAKQMLYKKYHNARDVGTSNYIEVQTLKPTYCTHYSKYQAGGIQKVDNSLRIKLLRMLLVLVIAIGYSFYQFFGFFNGGWSFNKDINTTKIEVKTIDTKSNIDRLNLKKPTPPKYDKSEIHNRKKVCIISEKYTYTKPIKLEKNWIGMYIELQKRRKKANAPFSDIYRVVYTECF